jgi:leucyl aminopeptidase
MDFSVKTGAPVTQKTACAIVPVFDGSRLPEISRAFDKASGGQLAALVRSGEISGELGKTTLLRDLKGIGAKRVLAVGCGPRKAYSGKALYQATAAALRMISGTSISNVVSYVAMAAPDDCDSYYCARLSVESARSAVYRFDELKSKAPPAVKLRRFGVAADRNDAGDARRGIADGAAIADGQDIARDLGNRPANVCTPTHLADVAKKLAREHKGLTCKSFGPQEIKKLGMGSFLSVTQGAAEPPRLIVLEYRGAGKDVAPIALCGKGVTFDTGGISIKPSPKMDEMKFDMCGAAGVIGTMAAIARLQPKLNVVAVVPACENMPSGTATRPGDIYKSLSGKTIEVLNTDAEGRLILCDALTWAQREYDPACVIDVATLTGACVVALGGIYTGVFSNDAELRQSLIDAGQRGVDPGWPMPADTEYGDSLRSNFADFANIGSREGGASIAAAFLGKFIDPDRRWAHLDIAGVAWRADSAKGATGRPVPMLVDFLLHQA